MAAKEQQQQEQTAPHDVKGGTTKASTFQEAAADATPSEQGFIGTSAERDRTGAEDKGLSQRNPAILTGGPVPDPRPGVDDADAISALKG